MRIAQVAPLTESVPPQLYGGTERVVAFIADELVRGGHEVTLFASGDSHTAATLVPCWPRALRLSGICSALAPHLLMLEEVARRARDFDIIHFHLSEIHLPLARRLPAAHVTCTVVCSGATSLGPVHPPPVPPAPPPPIIRHPPAKPEVLAT